MKEDTRTKREEPEGRWVRFPSGFEDSRSTGGVKSKVRSQEAKLRAAEGRHGGVREDEIADAARSLDCEDRCVTKKVWFCGHFVVSRYVL